MNRIISIIIFGICSSLLLVAAAPAYVHAKCGDERFLTMPAWYRDVAAPAAGGGCAVGVEHAKGASKLQYGGKIGTFVLTIALNIIEIMLHITAYTTIAFIIVGGFKYLTSNGAAEGNVNGRKTIINALIGLVLSVVSIAIVNFIVAKL